jgi:two-component system, OmpR family, osmolarity sensor histidine kinase EnvZ
MLERFLPTSLFVRFILIIVLPIIFSQSIAAYIFYNRHWHSVSKNMAHSLANDIQVVFNIEKYPVDSLYIDQIKHNLGIRIEQQEYNKELVVKDYADPESEFLYAALKQKYALPIKINFIEKYNAIRADIYDNGTVYRFIADSKRVDNPTTYIFMMWMTGASLIFLMLSIIFTRNQIRPIIKLARAADRFGKGQHNILLKPEGAAEIRKASSAFLKMQERIERQINHRAEMLAGVSHDLRTPLTRMKLQIAISKEEDLAPMLDDIKDMEHMINSYLDFARGDMREHSKFILLNKFLNQVTKPYNKNNYTINKIPNIKIQLKINAMKRCFQNLLDNAFKYGDKITLNSYSIQNELFIEIHDNGAGIPLEKRDEVFKPFFRLEESRNKDTGGVGLGLSITKDIINNHGGQIKLESSELLGGLKAVIILPL